MARALLALFMILSAPGPAFAGIEAARDAFAAGAFARARVMLAPLAEAGDADAQELMGVLYGLGLGVAQDRRTALDWYLRASCRGHAGAQSGVGYYFEFGLATPADLVEAHMWYALSAAGGDPDAEASLPPIEEKMTPAQIADAQARARAWRPGEGCQ